jgi:hypothetical protein
MSFNLEVTITGLCVFRVRPADDAMDVLMVAAGGHARHYPRVFYNAAYDNPNPVPLGSTQRRISLEDTVLDLSTFAGQGGVLGPIPDLVDLDFVTPLTDAEVLAAPSGLAGLACRVTLPRGFVSSPNPSGPWDLQVKGKPTQRYTDAAWHVVWTVSGITATELRWELDGLRDPYGQQLVPLYPKNGKIKLLISNVVLAESKPALMAGVRPAKGTPMTHFDAYHLLYTKEKPWPAELIYDGLPAPLGSGAPYSCLPSGGK